MDPVKIIFFDIDGTLVDHATGAISPKTRETLKQLHQQGILLCIATGRGPATLPDFQDLRFDAFCTYNGSLCYTESETIYRNPLHPADVSQVLKNAAAIDRPVSVAVRDRLAANGIDQDLADYYHLAGVELSVAPDFEQVCKQEIYQMMLGYRDGQREYITRETEHTRLAFSWDRAVDVVPANSSKGVAIEQILQYFHLTPSQSMAFGDSYNDMEMLQSVGTGIAMGNAPDLLKSVAKDVCGSVSEDGIYHYCAQHGLITEIPIR